MASPYLGEIRMFSFNFAPVGWALCDGQTLAINLYQALFSLLGTTYGGNGQNTFQLPDFQGRRPVHMGQGAALAPYVLGQRGGVENVALTIGEMPGHTHTVNATGEVAEAGSPKGKYLAASTIPLYVSAPSGVVTMSPSMLNIAGGGQPFSIIEPYLTVNFCIAMVGIYPSRN